MFPICNMHAIPWILLLNIDTRGCYDITYMYDYSFIHIVTLIFITRIPLLLLLIVLCPHLIARRISTTTEKYTQKGTEVRYVSCK